MKKRLNFILVSLSSILLSTVVSYAVVISGYVKDNSSVPISGVTVIIADQSSSSAATTTDGNGYYSFTVTGMNLYGVVPAKPGWMFSPTFKMATVIFSDVSNVNFFGTPVLSTYTVSGFIRDTSASPVPNVLLGLASTSTTYFGLTDTLGYYEIRNVLADFYALAPYKDKWIFTPPAQSYTPLNSDQSNQNFTAYPLPKLDGYVKDASSVPISGVTMTLSTLVAPATTYVTLTGANGFYQFTDIIGDNYALTLNKNGWIFSPPAKTFTPLNVDRSSENFTGFTILSTYSITGYIKDGSSVAVAGITMNLSGNETSSAVTGINGLYSFVNITSGTYTVTPAGANWFFSPPDKTYTLLDSNQSGQDFTAFKIVLVTCTISGYTKDASSVAISGVSLALSGKSTGTATTDTNGYYLFQNLSTGTYTVTPSKTGWTFEPTQRPYSPLTSDRTDENYTGTQTSTPTPPSPPDNGGTKTETGVNTVKPAAFHLGPTSAVRKKITELEEKVKNSRTQ